jgi:hypothetical protein
MDSSNSKMSSGPLMEAAIIRYTMIGANPTLISSEKHPYAIKMEKVSL